MEEETPTLHVLQAGVLATVQDRGRPNQQRWGVPVGGAMDQFALCAANRLVGNPMQAAGLEITAGGSAFEVLRDTLLAVTGADLGATLDNAPLPLWTAVWVRAGSKITFAGRAMGWGARAYAALRGGIDVPVLLGSRSTCLPGAFGGLNGRPLRAGDVLHGGSTSGEIMHAGRRWSQQLLPRYGTIPTLQVLPGPHIDRFHPDALDRLQTGLFRLGASSNRIGYRLEGERLHVNTPDLPSLPVFPGVIQVPPDGMSIMLMADAQPTGGYPVVAVVIASDLPLAAQLLPGDSLRFKLIQHEEARAAWRKMQCWLGAEILEDETTMMLEWAGG